MRVFGSNRKKTPLSDPTNHKSRRSTMPVAQALKAEPGLATLEAE